jgi:hypothetical protein
VSSATVGAAAAAAVLVPPLPPPPHPATASKFAAIKLAAKYLSVGFLLFPE